MAVATTGWHLRIATDRASRGAEDTREAETLETSALVLGNALVCGLQSRELCCSCWGCWHPRRAGWKKTWKTICHILTFCSLFGRNVHERSPNDSGESLMPQQFLLFDHQMPGNPAAPRHSGQREEMGFGTSSEQLTIANSKLIRIKFVSPHSAPTRNRDPRAGKCLGVAREVRTAAGAQQISCPITAAASGVRRDNLGTRAATGAGRAV